MKDSKLSLPKPEQPRNPLHGVTLEALLNELVAHYGWIGLAKRIEVRCFTHEPSVSSSLKFLRRTPWARAQVEALYLDTVQQPGAGGAGGKIRVPRSEIDP